MTDTTKVKYEKITTPKGIAVFPRLNDPDTKFVAEGQYSVRLRLSAEDAQPLIDRIDVLAQEMFDAEKARLMKGDGKAKAKAKTLKMADKAYKEAVDDEGNETGEYEFNFKMKAQYTNKKTSKITKQKPKLFDASGKALPDSVSVWGGSIIKVAAQYMPFATAIGVGVSLRMNAVQVIDLVTSGGGNAGSYGFGEEDGYTAPDADETPTGGSDETPDSDAGGDEF